MRNDPVSALPPIQQTLTLKAPIERVWSAVATSDGIAAWFMPNTFRPIAGGEFVLHAGPYGDSRCKVTDIDPPHRLAFDWDEGWHVVFDLKALANGGTEFTLTHCGWDAARSTRFGQPHAAVRDVMDKGWRKKVQEGLRSHLEG